MAASLGTTGCGLAGTPPSSGGDGNPGTGPALSSKLSASSPSVAFGNVAVGSPTSQQVTLTDVGTANVVISAVSANGNGFSASGGASVSLTPNQSVTVSVNFDPTAPGGVQGNLLISSNASNPSLKVGLSGTGVSEVVIHKVTLNWRASASAVIGYIVYRGSSSDSLVKLSGSIVPSTTYIDSDVSDGHTYYYAVASVNSSDTESAQSTPISVTIPSQ